MGQESWGNVVSSETLFWGQPEVSAIVGDGNLTRKILDREVVDWISSFYWGETLGIEYTLRLSELVETEEERRAWRLAYADELEHQAAVLGWLRARGLVPEPPSPLLRAAADLVERSRTAKTTFDMKDSILWAQIFLEELGAVMTRWRLSGVKDRDLKAVLYKIYRDEMRHISMGSRVLERIGIKLSGRKEILLEKGRELFPIHVARDLLPRRTLVEVSRAANGVTDRVLNDLIGSKKMYRPSQILQNWEKVSGYHCFACSPSRPEGLHLEPILDSVSRVVSDEFSLDRRFEGFNGVIHGGFTSMILDEIMGYALILNRNVLTMTERIDVSFDRPLLTGVKYRVESRILKDHGKRVEVQGTITARDSGKVIARSSGVFLALEKEVARRFLGDSVDREPLVSMFGDHLAIAR